MNRFSSRFLFMVGALVCAGLIGIALYLQHFAGLDPCPLCMLQRVAFIVVGVVCLVGAIHGPGKRGNRVYAVLAGLAALSGTGLAARHVWLQYNPPRFASCTGDLYSQLERLPLGRVIANAIRATGDCAKVDWTLLTLSIAEWSLIWFIAFVGLSIFLFSRPQT